MKNYAVFFDRDGTLNYDPGYIGNPELIELYPGVPQGISKLKEQNFKVVVISNQSGIARGYFTEKEVEAVNNRINELLQKFNTYIDAFYYCPFHPDFNTPEECECRKPSPSLVFKAAKELEIDLQNSYFVGDKTSDVECGMNAGIKTVFVKNSINQDEISYLKKQGKIPTFVADNFQDACNFIIKDFHGGI